MHKKKFNSLTVLIPAFNELKNLEKFLKDLSKRFNVLVVDDGSIDKTEIFLNKAADKEYILFLEHDNYNECCTVQHTEKGVRLKETFNLKEII